MQDCILTMDLSLFEKFHAVVDLRVLHEVDECGVQHDVSDHNQPHHRLGDFLQNVKIKKFLNAFVF